MASRGPDAVMVVSLTRAAALEISGRKLPLPRNSVGTLHSHAYRALGNPEIAEVHADEWSAAHPAYRVKGAGVGSIDEASSWATDGHEGEDRLLSYTKQRAMQVPRGAWSYLDRQFADRWEDWKKQNGYIDFEDMIEIAGRDLVQAPGKPELIYADEAQDFARSEMALLLKWGEANGCDGLVIVGDYDQAIFEFRGADPQMIRNLKVPPERRKVLEQSWRVPRKVHDLALRWISRVSDRDPVIYRPRDAEGSVRKKNITRVSASEIVDEAQRLSETGTVMVLASCAFMIAPIATLMRKRGVPFHNPYCPKRGDWNPLRSSPRVSDYMRSDPGTWGKDSRLWTYEELAHWLEVVATGDAGLTRGVKAEVERLAKNEDTKRMVLEPCDVAALFDLDGDSVTVGGALLPTFDPPVQTEGTRFLDAHGIVRLPDRSTERNPIGGDPKAALQWLVRNALDTKRRLVEYPAHVAQKYGGAALKETPRICLSTIHGCKGGEADHVILFPDISPRGLEEWESGNRDATIRLFYVAVTRSRESLTICEPANKRLCVRGLE